MAGSCFPQSGPQASPGYITWPENEKVRKKEFFLRLSPASWGLELKMRKWGEKRFFLQFEPSIMGARLGLKMRRAKRWRDSGMKPQQLYLNVLNKEAK